PAVTLGKFTTIKCENPGPGKTPPERCDHITFFEDALARAVRENQPCAPPIKGNFAVSYVMELNFRTKKLNVFAGKSTTIKREKTKDLLQCIRRAMPTPDWGTIPHQYVKYKVSLLGNYPPHEGL